MTDNPGFPVAFHFAVSFVGQTPPVKDAAFQEISGLESRIEVETVVEGGENRFVHQLPKGVRHGNLILKRGLTDRTSGLLQWCKQTLEGDFATRIQPKDVNIRLLGTTDKPLAVWNIGNAYPIKWSVAGFDAMKNAIAIETIELAFSTLKRDV